MKNISWDNYQIFLDVAHAGGLTGAASRTGLSPATLGRRMLELEQQLGRVLFARSQGGYALTQDGRVLLEHLQSFEAAQRNVDAWRGQTSARALVRVTSGTWLAWFMTENFATLHKRRDPFRVELCVTEERAALAYRETDIGIRAFEPEEPNLAKTFLGEVAYAAYCHRNAEDWQRQPWLAVSQDAAISAYLQWPHAHVAEHIIVTVNRPRSLKDLVMAGMGRAVLPCFVGDYEPQLQRAGGEIVALRHRQWLVTNADDRDRPEIRTFSKRLVRLLKERSDAFIANNTNKL
ncbi:LysR family transcriptional regulator [Rhizobium sp.]|uniref:LysR family transcriptional regulator n=1 Tax=Rhizobium sp. TaxID=391 RepID=UPI000E8FEA40|nr:LysR family transcriptional regulator [Rhizobium sp.]